MHRLVFLLLPFLCAACARLAALEGPPKSLAHLAEEAPPALVEAEPAHAPTLKEVVDIEPSPAFEATRSQSGESGIPPPPPALLPATVYPVWVPDHLTDDDTYVTGHWVYILQEPVRWPLPRIPGPATVKVPRPPEPSAGPLETRGLRAAPLQGVSGYPSGVVSPAPPSPPRYPPLTGVQPPRPLLPAPSGVPGQGTLVVPGLLPPGGGTP